mgnify:CR=1 FL=1
METRAKLPKKVLSMFLSLLMALSCFSIALPELIPTADAASTTAQWTVLQNAFDTAEAAGYLSGANASVDANGNTVTVNDTSDKGYLYSIANALYAIVKADASSYNHHDKMRAYIKSKLSLNSYQQDFIDQLLPIAGNLVYSDSNPTFTAYQLGSWPSGLPVTGNITVNVTVTRSVKAAIVADCATAAAVPANINTSVKYTMTATPAGGNNDYYTSNWSTGSGSNAGSGTDYYYRNVGYYTNGTPSVTNGTSATPNLSAITNYLNHTNGTFKADYEAGLTNWVGTFSNLYG